jgi:hypothetical protein
MRSLFAWAKEAGFVTQNPAADVSYPKLKSAKASQSGAKTMLPPMRRGGLWAHVSGYGLPCCYTLVCAVATLCALVASMCAMESQPSAPRRPALRYTCRYSLSCRKLPTADLAFVCGANGKPMTKESFGKRLLRGLPGDGREQVCAWMRRKSQKAK